MTKPRRVLDHLLTMCLACSLLLNGCGNPGSSRDQIESESSGPILKWKVELGQDLYTNLTVVNGVVYATTNNDVYALDATNGKTKWQIDPPGSPLSSPAVSDDTVYVGAPSSYDLDTRTATVTAFALDAQMGSIKWQYDLSNDRSEDSSNPVVAGTLAYFGTGWSDWSCCDFRGSGGRITALDGESGQLVWQVETKANYGSGGSPTSTFVVANGMLYLGAGYGGPAVEETHLLALDAKTGKEVWKIASEVTFPFVAPDGTLYIVLQRELLSINGKTGQEKWRWTLDSSKDSLSDPALVEDTVYVVGNEERDICFEGPCSPPENHTDTLYALDAATGKEKWKQDIDGGYYPTGDIIRFEQYLCYEIADYSGNTRHWYLRAIDHNDGKSRWHFEVDGSIFGLPALMDDTMYLGTSNGSIYALQLP